MKLPTLRITIPVMAIWRAVQAWRKQRARRRFRERHPQVWVRLSRKGNRR